MTDDETSTVLELRGVRRRFEASREVLTGVDLAVEPGEVVGLLGKNGAGKTTLLRIAVGMLHAHGGAVRVLGADPMAEPVAVKRRLGYVAEDSVLPGHLRVRDVIALHRALYPRWDERFERSAADRFELDPRRRVATLSKGQARRLALVCAVAHRPELLLLDEPAGGLDPAARREFLEVAIELLSEEGTAIVFSSHHMGDVERIAGRVALLDEGRVLVDCELDELREGYSVAIVGGELAAAPDARARLEALEGCVRARVTRTDGSAVHAVFRAEPARVREVLARDLAVEDARCTRVALEDLFVDLVGGSA